MEWESSKSPVIITARTFSRIARSWISNRSPTSTTRRSAGYWVRRLANDSKFMAPTISTRSSSVSRFLPTRTRALRVSAMFLRLACTRRESKRRFLTGKKNLLSLKTDNKPAQEPSGFSTGSTRMLFASRTDMASAAVVSMGTLTTWVAMISLTRPDTSGTKRGAGTPKVFRTKSMRSLVSPQRAATASGMPVRRLYSA